MATLCGRLKNGLLAGLTLAAFVAIPSLAAQPTMTVDARDLVIRLQRVERDLRDLQAETFRRPPGQPLGQSPGPLPSESAGSSTDLNPIMRRMDELNASVSRLTGQMEELGHQVDQLSQKTDRLQKEMDYQAQQASGQRGPAGLGPEGAAAPADAGGPPPGEVASLAPRDQGPPQGSLGQIPTDAPLPTPGRPLNLPPPPPAADPKADFDNAMNLLSRAQYTQASQAFRSFADAYPDDARAATALYWTGDIAYSTQKDYDVAARDFAELLKKYPMAQRAPEGMLKLGLSLFELGQMKEGCAALAALPVKYPAASAAIATRARNERRDRKCR
jgi:tol-pal system protein YbgF